MNQCKYCGTDTKNEHFCSKKCQARHNTQENRNTKVQFICQKHSYSKIVRVTDLSRTKCPHCQAQKRLQSIRGKLCQKCGSPILEYIGTGRFCSRACANSRVHTQQSKNQIARTLKKDKCINYIRNCVICGKSFYHKRNITCSKQCLSQRLIQNGRDINIRERISGTIKKRVQTGNHKGWNSRKIISYPQKFFMNVLDNNGIEYIHNYKVLQKQLDQSLNSCFFLDFYLPKYNIDLQIDGKQHKYLDRIQQDVRRDNLISRRYTVYRIQWNEINTEQGKSLIKQKINKFFKALD